MPLTERIAFFHTLQLSDMLCAVPTLCVLRSAWPPECFAVVANAHALTKDSGQIAIIRTADEHRIVQSMLSSMIMPATDLTGKSAISSVIAVAFAQLRRGTHRPQYKNFYYAA